VSVICPNCGTENPDAANFCMNCGFSLKELSPAGVPEAARQAVPAAANPATQLLQQFMPRELVTKLESVRTGHWSLGERRIVTMLFCDVKDSTASASRLDPEDWSRIMNGAFERMIRPIYRYEGTVARLMGDGILAFFGAPLAHEDDPQRGVQAGLEIVAAFNGYRQQVMAQSHLDLQIRVGINTGLVVVGEVGSDMRLEYTALGDAINLASRMEQTAQPGTVQIAENTYRLVASMFDVRDLGRIQVKGKEMPVQAYQVLRRKRSTHGRPASYQESIAAPFVGRQAERERLHRAFKALREDHGGIVALHGDAGIGKSRLLTEVRAELGAGALRWLVGEALSFGRTISYWTFQVILRQDLGITEDDTDDQAWLKLERRLTDLLDDDAADILPYLGTMLGLEVPEAYAARVKYLDSEVMRLQIFRATRLYFERLAAEGPIVLVFEDLHWSDESSIRLLEHLLPLAHEARVLVVGIGRPAVDSPWVGVYRGLATLYPALFHEIRLQPLTVGESVQLCEGLLGRGSIPSDLRQVITSRAEGNPFFIEEIVRTLVDTEALVFEEDSGWWRLASQLGDADIPDSLRGTIMARIDRLDEALRRVLRTSAVVGRTFSVPILRAVVQDEPALEAELRRLAELQLIEARPGAADTTYAFKYALVHEVSYESLLLQERRALHAAVGAAIEERFSDRLDDYYGVLAFHYARAEAWEKAQDYLVKAGDRAGRIAADAEALSYYRSAVSTYARGAGEGWDPVQRANLERKLGEALLRRAEYESALDYLQQALVSLGQKPMPTGPREMRLSVFEALGRQTVHRLTPRFMRRRPTPLPEPWLAELVDVYTAYAGVAAFRERSLLLTAALAILNVSEQRGYPVGIAAGSTALGMAADLLPAFALARGYHERAIAFAHQTGNPRTIGLAYLGRMLHDYLLGRWDLAMDSYAQTLASFGESGDLRYLSLTGLYAVVSLSYSGQLTRAEEVSRFINRTGQEAGDTQILGWAHLTDSMLQRYHGHYEAAVAAARKAHEKSYAILDMRSSTWATAEIGRALTAAGDYDAAMATFDPPRVHGFDLGVRAGPRAAFLIGRAELYLALLEQSSGHEREKWRLMADEACQAAVKGANAMRGAMPEALRLAARGAFLSGRQPAAERTWRRSLALAQRQRQPYDAALIHLDAGRYLRRADRLAQAEKLFRQLGVEILAERARQTAT
jgi:class 3 adenylate cyclase/tetratricopeptide (TPR) repeat protein